MGNWDTGRWGDLARSCYSLVSELWSRQTDSPCSDLLSDSPVSFLIPSWFASIPFHSTGPWFWQDMAWASVLPFGYAYSEGFPWHFLSCFCLGLNTFGGFSSWWPGERLLLHLWAFTNHAAAVSAPTITMLCSVTTFCQGLCLTLCKNKLWTPTQQLFRWVFYHLAVEEIKTQRG